jgi:spore maturation protein CgeB
VAAGFNAAGYIAETMEYQEPAVGLVNQIKYSTLPNKFGFPLFLKLHIERLVDKLIQVCRDASLLIIIKGDLIPMPGLERLRKSCRIPMVTWFMDAVSNVKEGRERALLSDMLLYFEGSDESIVRSMGVPSHQVDLAYDDRWYFPVSGEFIRYNVSFVGAPYRNRMVVLNDISRGLAGKGFSNGYFGSFPGYLSPMGRIKTWKNYPYCFPWLRNRKNLSHDEINILNSQSLIGLNILHPQSKDSLNMRAFETCGSGCFQLLTENAAVGRCYEKGAEVDTYSSPEEGVEKILFYCEHQDSREKMAKRGFEKARCHHTMRERVLQILGRLRDEGLIPGK